MTALTAMTPQSPLAGWRRRAVACLAAAGVLGPLGACGIGVDETPRAIQGAADTTTTIVSPSSGVFAASLYFVREGALIPVTQELPDQQLATEIAALLQTPAAATRTNGLSTSIPAGTELREVTRVGDRARIDLSSSFDNLVGPSRQQAIGQMVLTATAKPGVDTVSFQVDGETITVSSRDRGDQTEVNECDFADLLANSDDLVGVLPNESIQDLVGRRTELAERCEGQTPGG